MEEQPRGPISRFIRMRLESSILRAIAYFDLFDHPLLEEDIYFFLDKPASRSMVSNCLESLVREGSIYRHGGFYALRDEPALVERRLKGHQIAKKLLGIGFRKCRLLFCFPYVRGVGISGSLSKNVAAEDSDIDYFIITRKNRLWIARTLMHLLKKISFLFGKQNWYCMNYFIDEDALTIQEKNIFTATELVTLVPACGEGALESFFEKNEWAYSYFPNSGEKKILMQGSYPNPWYKKMVEYLLNNRVGDFLDNFFWSLTAKRWNAKTTNGAVNKRGIPLALKTSKHFSKPDPALFQSRIIKSLDDRLKMLQTRWPNWFSS